MLLLIVATTMPGYAARSQSRAGLIVGTWPISMLACGVADVCVRRNVWSVAYAVKHGSAKVIHGRAVRPGVCDGAEACLPRTVDLSAVCFRDVLEFRGSVRANGRALSGRAAWPHYGRRLLPPH